MYELLKQFLTDLFRLLYELWVAPADRALELLSVLTIQLCTIFITYLVLRWMWRKVWGK